MRLLSAAPLLFLVALAASGCHKAAPAPAPPAETAAAASDAHDDGQAIAATAAAATVPAARANLAKGAIRHVIIVSEDGLRPDALMDVHPPVHEAIMHKGSWSLVAQTIRHASTLPSHAAMLSGFDMKEHGLSWNSWQPQRGYILVPTIFDAASKAGDKAAAFVGKRKLEHIAHPGSVDVFSRPGFFCKKVVEEATRYFVDKRPQVEFIHFSDPDERGHAVGWMSDPQMDAIRHTDRCLGTLVDAVTAAGLDDQTLFILSADHGGHGRNHSGAIKEDRLIPWIAWGPGVRPNHRIRTPISTVDTAATALWALGYPGPPGMLGRPVLEAFDASIGGTDPASTTAVAPTAVPAAAPVTR
ncbi:MAG TPA: alkaline phosphatase [Polyangia bacterium]|jgi:arylsulfatase A-like enzyme|nr:alkaline phosphatase [Polyangia bacterium]